MPDAQIESALQKMIELESALSRLYALYAKRFPSRRGLWTTLSYEEFEHAARISKLAEQARKGEFEIPPGRFKPEAAQAILDSLAGRLAEAEAGVQPVLDCLSIAVNLESTLIEKDLFRIFPADPADLKESLQRLAAETQHHQMKIMQAWQEAAREAGP
jgi:hypothetical protein